MKKFSGIILIVLFSNFVVAQELSIGFNYSGLITSNNYQSASLYSLEADFEIVENSLTAGFSATVSDTRITKTFIKNPSPDDPFETSFKLGLQGKYYPFLFQKDSFSLKPFIGIELGLYNTTHIETYQNIPSSCLDDYSFRSRNDFYTNFSLGGIIFSEQALSFVFALKYQINNPTFKYIKPNCTSDGGWTVEPDTEFEEKVKLNIMLWSIGFKVNL